ncbi:hypothetical protein [Nonomuraea sp. GTA35]|uniref:hypothetical protein n=1 Tax=Nonomuraea sp. GTA35 TaxID=1676746 RepID=UPI0035BEBBF9
MKKHYLSVYVPLHWADPPEDVDHDTALRRWQDADARLRALLILDTDADAAHPSHRGGRSSETCRDLSRDDPVPGRRAHEEAAVSRHLALLEHAAREFSRTVPGPYKRTLRLTPATEPEADPRLEEFFDCLEPVTCSRRSLYLWI